MSMNNNNNNKKISVRDSNNKNVITKTEINDRFCKHCFLQLVPRINEPSIYSCPRCGVSSNRKDTYPNTTLRTTFPTFSQFDPIKKHVLQSDDQKLPRSEAYFKKRQMERNKIESNDPYLAMLKSRNDLHITNVEYYSYDNNDYY